MNSNRCRECMGTGGIERLETCSVCKGTGKISDPVVEAADVKRYRFKGAAGEYVYSVDFDKAQAEIKRLKLVEEVWKLQKDLPAAMIEALEEIERLKAVTNFKEAVACVFDNLKMVAANTSSKVWDDLLEELAEEVIEFAPEYKKQWRDIVTAQVDLVASEKKNAELLALLNRWYYANGNGLIQVDDSAYSVVTDTAVVIDTPF